MVDAARYTFDLGTEIPLRVTLFRLAEDEHVLVAVLHHIVADGVSITPLVAASGTEPRRRFELVAFLDELINLFERAGDEIDAEHFTRPLAQRPLPTEAGTDFGAPGAARLRMV